MIDASREREDLERLLDTCDRIGRSRVACLDVLSVQCPTCKAEPGRVCRTRSGKPVHETGRPAILGHALRQDRMLAVVAELQRALDDDEDHAIEAGNEVLRERARRMRSQVHVVPVSELVDRLERGLWQKVCGPRGAAAFRGWRSRRLRWLRRQVARSTQRGRR